MEPRELENQENKFLGGVLIQLQKTFQEATSLKKLSQNKDNKNLWMFFRWEFIAPNNVFVKNVNITKYNFPGVCQVNKIYSGELKEIWQILYHR